jgi:broad specificity phosphatase PhoE
MMAGLAGLVRPGETAWTLTGQHTGVNDLSLTAYGENESRALHHGCEAWSSRRCW